MGSVERARAVAGESASSGFVEASGGLSVENGAVVAAGIAVGNARIGDVGGIIGACLIAA